MDEYGFESKPPPHILAAKDQCGVVDMKPSKARHMPALEWLGDLSGQEARITSMGSSMLLVENHCGICSFSNECIILCTRRGCVEICGRNLSLCQVRSNALMIRGAVASVKLPCREADGHEP